MSGAQKTKNIYVNGLGETIIYVLINKLWRFRNVAIGGEFDSRVQRIARVYLYGLRELVSRKGPDVKYSERRLLGINDETYDIT